MATKYSLFNCNPERRMYLVTDVDVLHVPNCTKYTIQQWNQRHSKQRLGCHYNESNTKWIVDDEDSQNNWCAKKNKSLRLTLLLLLFVCELNAKFKIKHAQTADCAYKQHLKQDTNTPDCDQKIISFLYYCCCYCCFFAVIVYNFNLINSM